jgi:hypothetical protein
VFLEPLGLEHGISIYSMRMQYTNTVEG